MSGHIRLDLRAEDFPSSFDQSIVVPLSESVIRHTFQPIDFPSANADTYGRMLCTDTVTIRKTLKARKELAEILVKALLDAMSAKDMENGYLKEQPK